MKEDKINPKGQSPRSDYFIYAICVALSGADWDSLLCLALPNWGWSQAMRQHRDELPKFMSGVSRAACADHSQAAPAHTKHEASFWIVFFFFSSNFHCFLKQCCSGTFFKLIFSSFLALASIVKMIPSSCRHGLYG